ncbi:MAG: thiamine phosphate synthase [Terracidiphilus sp.]|nr:thiamine phosphate synthase [Terracidiphilus sp.]
MPFSFPRIYPILDSSVFPATGRAGFLDALGRSLADAGVTLLEYRNKSGTDVEILADAAVLRTVLPTGQVRLVLDDRAHLVGPADFDGVHVDSGDVSPVQARELLGIEAIVGTYGGTESLLPGILDEPADYFSVGPIAPTDTKQTEKAPIGVAGVHHLRAEAGPKPVLVAAGGVSFDVARQLIEAGASVLAVSAAIFRTPDPARELRRWMQQVS